MLIMIGEYLVINQIFKLSNYIIKDFSFIAKKALRVANDQDKFEMITDES